MATNNSKPAAELRIGTVKATVWENEVGGITHHNVTFSRIYPEGGQWKTTQSFRFVNLLSRCQARRPGTHTHCRAQGRGGPGGWGQQSQLSAAPSGGGLNRVAFFPWTPVPARGRGALSETITA